MAEDEAAIERAAVAAITAEAGGGDGADAKMTDEGDVVMHGEMTEGEVGKDDGEDVEGDLDDVDAQIEVMRRRLKHVEAEAQRLQMHNGGEGGDVAESSGSGGVGGVGGAPSSNVTFEPIASNGSANGASAPNADPGAGAPPSGTLLDPSAADVESAIAESDGRSVYVGNVDYGATVDELSAHFADCGTINRVTIMTNKATGMPKGFAYIEFADESSVKHATILDSTTFRHRKIKVVAKRTNVPGMSYRGTYGRRPRYRGGGRGYGRRPRRGFRGRWAPY